MNRADKQTASVFSRRSFLRLTLLAMVVGATVGMFTRGSGAQPASSGSVGDSASKPRSLRIVASIPPIQGIVRALTTQAQVSADVETLIPVGVSEHGYEIPPGRLNALAKADMVVLVGMGLEPQIDAWLRRNPVEGRAKVVLSEAIGLTSVTGGGSGGTPANSKAHDHDHDHNADHVHGPDCDHSAEGGLDPHIWLDPVLVERMIPAIGSALRSSVRGDAEAIKRMEAAEAAVISKIRDLNDRYSRTIKQASRRTIVVGHDAWWHLADRYELENVAIKGLTASEPTPSSLTAASKAIRERGITTVFVEPQLRHDAGERIARLTGARVRILDPLGDGDWFAMMNANLLAIAEALGVAPDSGAAPNSNPTSAEK